MKVTRTIHKNVLNERDNLDHEEIQNITYGGVFFSCDEGGCHLDKCNCSDGHWVKIQLPLNKDGNYEIILIEFNNESDFFTFKENSIL